MEFTVQEFIRIWHNVKVTEHCRVVVICDFFFIQAREVDYPRHKNNSVAITYRT